MLNIKLYNCGIKGNSEFPLGLGYLKTNCQANIKIVSNKTELINCDLIGLSTSANGIAETIEILNNTCIPVIVGGEGTLWEGLNNYSFKHIIIGEGENALNKIINGTSEKIIREELIENLDGLNFPARGICGSTVPIVTSRGCPFKCAFCSVHPFWKDTYRLVSSKYFIDEIKYILKTYPLAKTIYLVDDLFIFCKNRFNEIFEKWMEKKFNDKLSLRGFIRADTLTLEVAKKMKLMGFKKVEVGIESGSDRILKLINKKTTVTTNQQVIDIANEAGLTIMGSFIYEIPGETKEDFNLTLQFIEKNKNKLIVHAWNKFIPLPGTELYKGQSPLNTDMCFVARAQKHCIEKNKS